MFSPPVLHNTRARSTVFTTTAAASSSEFNMVFGEEQLAQHMVNTEDAEFIDDDGCVLKQPKTPSWFTTSSEKRSVKPIVLSERS
jgi:hypothetical protein